MDKAVTDAVASPGPLPTYEHLILPPLEFPGREPATAAEDCLMVIAPGALLPPDAFRALAAATQAAAPHLRLWCGALNVDSYGLAAHLCGANAEFMVVSQAMASHDVYGQLLQQLLDQAAARGFVGRKEGPVRVSNMVLVCQSAGSLGFADLAIKRAAATVLLASVANAFNYVQHQVISAEAWPRPLMMLMAELDGQMRWPRVSGYIAETAAMATKLGTGFTAANKPIIVVPGVNHGNTSSGVPRTMRGDITVGVAEYDACMQLLGSRLAMFLTVHLATTEAARGEANAALVEAVRESMQLVAPYCIARGLGDPSAPFVAAAGDPLPPLETPAGPARVGGLVAGAQRSAGQPQSQALPPGEVVAAESHAVELQRHVLAGLPAAALQRLTVVATAHTNVETFLYSQPLLVPLEGGRWLLQVHVLMHFRSLDGDSPFLAAQAPDYGVKLKGAHFVAALLGLPNPSQYTTPMPADLNRLALEHALAACPAPVVERYRALGRQLEFGGDWDAMAPGPGGELPASPEKFVRESRIAFRFPPKEDTGAAAAASGPAPPPPPADSMGAVRVGSPYVVVPPPADVATRPLGETRFMGAFYTKVMSVPQAMEWVWLDCLRAMDSPW